MGQETSAAPPYLSAPPSAGDGGVFYVLGDCSPGVAIARPSVASACRLRSQGCSRAPGRPRGILGHRWLGAHHFMPVDWLERERRESARAAARHAGTAVDRRSAARACQLLGAGNAGRRSGPESCDGAWEGGCERAARGAGPGVAHGPGPHGRRCPGLPPAAVLSCAGRCRSCFREACGRMRASSSASSP